MAELRHCAPDCRWHVSIPTRGWTYHCTTLGTAARVYHHLARRERAWLHDPIHLKRNRSSA